MPNQYVNFKNLFFYEPYWTYIKSNLWVMIYIYDYYTHNHQCSNVDPDTPRKKIISIQKKYKF